MPRIAWVQYNERVVARGSPRFEDVTNRPLRQLVELHGWNPDDTNFTGLHHFPSGVFTDTISSEEETAITVEAGLIVNADDVDVIFNISSNVFRVRGESLDISISDAGINFGSIPTQINIIKLKSGVTTWYRPDGVTAAMQYDSDAQAWTFFDKIYANSVETIPG